MSSEKPAPAPAVQWHSQVAAEFDASYGADARFQDRYRVWRELLDAVLQPHHRALDLGCGAGSLLLPLAEACQQVTGIDGSGQMLDLCRQKLARAGLGNVELRQADLSRLDALDLRGFDVIVASSVLEYLPDLDDTLPALGRALAPGGTLLFSIPNGDSLYRRAEPLIYRLTGRPAYFPYVVTVPRRQAMARRLADHGFRILDERLASPTPVLSALLRPAGLARYGDNLRIFRCAPADGTRAA